MAVYTKQDLNFSCITIRPHLFLGEKMYIEQLIKKAKKEIRHKISGAPTLIQIFEKRGEICDLPRSIYCCERTDYHGYADLSGCDIEYHAVYLCLKDILEKERGNR